MNQKINMQMNIWHKTIYIIITEIYVIKNETKYLFNKYKTMLIDMI